MRTLFGTFAFSVLNRIFQEKNDASSRNYNTSRTVERLLHFYCEHRESVEWTAYYQCRKFWRGDTPRAGLPSDCGLSRGPGAWSIPASKLSALIVHIILNRDSLDIDKTGPRAEQRIPNPPGSEPPMRNYAFGAIAGPGSNKAALIRPSEAAGYAHWKAWKCTFCRDLLTKREWCY